MNHQLQNNKYLTRELHLSFQGKRSSQEECRLEENNLQESLTSCRPHISFRLTASANRKKVVIMFADKYSGQKEQVASN